MNEPWSLTAADALAAMRAKDLSPVELLESVIGRAEAVEPSVNAFAERRFEQALTSAKTSADRYVAGSRIRPLEGLPVALKEEVPVRGWQMRYGSLAIDEVAETTSPLAERILKAGAVVHARTTTPELSCAGYTHSKLWGVTRNPWNTEVTVGGSSGGSGASLAAGSSMLASGSDIGGSIRLPASMNGVVGFKPPHGRVPVDPPFNLDRYCHDGPMARTVTDCALFENVLAGPHPHGRHVAATEAPDPVDPEADRRLARGRLREPRGVGRGRGGGGEHTSGRGRAWRKPGPPSRRSSCRGRWTRSWPPVVGISA